MNDKKIIEFKYPDGFTLLEALTDTALLESLPTNYLPEFMYNENANDLFIGTESYTYKNVHTPYRNIFIYLNSRGVMITDPNIQFTQISKNRTGFLVKLSSPVGSWKTPEVMTLDYIVDISKIQYETNSAINSLGTQIIEDFDITFKNISMSDYSDNSMNWDPRIREFSLNRKELFELFF